MRREEPLALCIENLYEYGIEVRRSISPISDDTSLKKQNAERDISINKEVYKLVREILVKENGYFLILVVLSNLEYKRIY
ncbi:hypothetical protein SAMN05880584_12072 [Bacillus altitudinis]|nr:hypothetical protein SAMN05880584_12072 [Bacillus altitudinis]